MHPLSNIVAVLVGVVVVVAVVVVVGAVAGARNKGRWINVNFRMAANDWHGPRLQKSVL